MDLNPGGTTPIDPDEAEGLIPALSTQAELNSFEGLNIRAANVWLASRRGTLDVLQPANLKLLHKQMFGETWRWAGKYRTTQKSIGIEAHRISTELLNLTEDAKTWLQHDSYPPTEIAARFHHRLVSIHAFPNGNGRHARLATELLCIKNGFPLSDWGADDSDETRNRYLAALRQADRGDIRALVEFMYPS